MKSKQLTINGVEITAHSDGSITKPFYKKTKRTFGFNAGKGYKQIFVGDTKFLVHRLIAQAFLPKFLDFTQVDHIDNDGFNNDVNNLRMVTNQKNAFAKQRKPKGCSSQYRGVCWQKQSSKWKAHCKIYYKLKYLGLFDNEREAAMARDAYAFSQGFPLEGLNFPENFA